jgi:hypothetical protein
LKKLPQSEHGNIKVDRTFYLFQLDVLIADINNVRETHGETSG